ncbi:MAG: prolyl oligopeptidase family serine peptidase [bacterium]
MRNMTFRTMMASCYILTLFFLPVLANDTSNRLTSTDVFNFEFAADPQISPDGSKIIYVRQFSDIMTDKRYSNLWIINFDGTNHRALTTGNYHDSSPRWSPDGSRIIYISDRESSSQIYLRWMDNGQTYKLTNLEYPPSGIAWSPDGAQISFTTHVPEPPRMITDLPAPPAEAKWAEKPMVIDKLLYRWNRVGYIKPGYTHLFVLPAEGGTPRQISTGNFYHGGFGFFTSEAVWTPDGKYLIMSVNRREDYEYEPRDTEIYEFSIEERKINALTDRRGPDNSPRVSPDGKYIAYLGFDDQYQGYQLTQLYVMNRDGSGSRVLSGNLGRSVRRPRWAADSKGIYFLYDDQGNTKLGYISLDGKFKQLASNIGTSGTAYSTGFFSLARNGKFAITYTRPHVPGDLAVASVRNPKVRVITSLNEDILAHKSLGEVEEIWYESSLDQRKIQGWIIKPPDFDPNKKYPLILEIHGGPFANYGDRFDVEKQIWAANDFVVLYVNPRGSTSYGEEFGNLIHHAYPGDDFYDLNSGVDAVIARGYIDTDNLFVTGGSGGGVLTCWMIGRTDRFRAAASAYPVINWYSFTLTADISSFVAKYWFPGLPWDYTEEYMNRSLTSVVKNVKTPTMVITGEEDYRTPMSESEQYYQALKLLKIDSVLVRVPGEPHGVRQRPSHHMAKIMYIMNWFKQHMEKT